MSRVFWGFLFSCLFLFELNTARAEVTKSETFYETSDCGFGNKQGVSYKYCITPTDRTKNPDILYYLHFMWGNENSYDKYFRYPMGQEYKKYGMVPPTVVAISFGRSWHLNEHAKKNLHSLFVDQLMPIMEKMALETKGTNKIPVPLGERHIVGQSMGGFNATMLFTKSGRLFSRIALQCPAITTLSPLATPEEIQDYIERTGADPEYVESMVAQFKKQLPTKETVDAHNPFLLAKQKDLNPKSQIYVSCGDKDEYGFFEGASLLKDITIEKGIRTQWVPIPGGKHCAADPVSTVKFLALGLGE